MSLNTLSFIYSIVYCCFQADFLIAYLSNPNKYSRHNSEDGGIDKRKSTPTTATVNDPSKYNESTERKDGDEDGYDTDTDRLGSKRVNSSGDFSSSGKGNSNSKRTISAKDLQRWEQ